MVRVCSISRCWDLEQRSPVRSDGCGHSRRTRGGDVYKRQVVYILVKSLLLTRFLSQKLADHTVTYLEFGFGSGIGWTLLKK